MLRPFYLLILFISIVSAHHRRSYPSFGTVVNLRIEGSNTTIFESPVFTWSHNITTLSGGTHECSGLNNHSNPQPGPTPSSALDDAARRSGFTFDGIFSTEFDDFFITRIGPDAQTSTQFWGTLLNFQFTPVGGCQQEVREHDNILWAFDAFNANAFLKLDGPTLVRREKDVTFTVTDGTSGKPIENASVGGSQTNINGHVNIQFRNAGVYGLKATKESAIRSNLVSVHVV